jgi:signal transduction histidine kinase
LRIEGDAAGLEPAIAECVHAIVFEALRLVVEPGRASTVTVIVHCSNDARVRIRDDGVGLDQRPPTGGGPGYHFAVSALRDRLRPLGGALEVAPARPRGVELLAYVPRDAVARRAPIATPVRT